MALQLPQNPTDGQIVKIGNRTFRWNAGRNRWDAV
jgi:hypothetical protein